MGRWARGGWWKRRKCARRSVWCWATRITAGCRLGWLLIHLRNRPCPPTAARRSGPKTNFWTATRWAAAGRASVAVRSNSGTEKPMAAQRDISAPAEWPIFLWPAWNPTRPPLAKKAQRNSSFKSSLLQFSSLTTPSNCYHYYSCYNDATLLFFLSFFLFFRFHLFPIFFSRPLRPFSY